MKNSSLIVFVGVTALLVIGGYEFARRASTQPHAEIPVGAVEELPVLATLEPFALTAQDGKTFTVESLKGVVTIVNFIFTRCPGVCPMLTTQMSNLERNTRDLGDSVRFVSVSVDPEYDTPERMRRYAEARQLDLSRWTFVTGPLDTVESVVVNGFRSAFGKRQVASEEEEDAPSLMQVTHGENFVLVDRLGRIRAFRTAKSQEDLQTIISLVKQLSRQSS